MYYKIVSCLPEQVEGGVKYRSSIFFYEFYTMHYMHTYLSECSNTFWPLYQAIFRDHLLLYYHVIYLCKVGVSLVFLYYKTCPVPVLKLLKLSCIITAACSTVILHLLSQLNSLHRRHGRNPW